MPDTVTAKITPALLRAGRREIGGLLMGEHVDAELFRIVDVTLQEAGGSSSRFVRDAPEHLEALTSFIDHHGNPSRFNYLGEWHSHPLHGLRPSFKDCSTMREIVTDPDPQARASIAVLMIVKLASQQLQTRAYSFLPERPVPDEIDLMLESGRLPTSSLH